MNNYDHLGVKVMRSAIDYLTDVRPLMVHYGLLDWRLNQSFVP
jgi:hypothetical protein